MSKVDMKKYKKNPCGVMPIMFYRGHIINVEALPENYVMVDLGACWGMMGRFFLNNLPQKCKTIYAVEPARFIYDYLLEMVKVYPKIKPYHCAVVGQNEPGFLTFHDCADQDDDSGIGWSFGDNIKERLEDVKERHNINIHDSYRIRTVKINDLLELIGEDHIDYLSIDVEGAERGILKTASKEFMAKVTQISVEVHFADEMDGWVKLLMSLGFKTTLNYRRGSLYGWREEIRSSMEKIK